jgi:hypothetical protein
MSYINVRQYIILVQLLESMNVVIHSYRSPVYDTIDEAKIQVEIKSPSAHFPDHYQSLQWKNSDSPGHAVAAKGNGSDISPSNSPGYEKLLRKVSNLANPTYGMPSTENIQTSTIPNEPVYEVPLVTGVDQ